MLEVLKNNATGQTVLEKISGKFQNNNNEKK
jgi:hypothetical protein